MSSSHEPEDSPTGRGPSANDETDSESDDGNGADPELGSRPGPLGFRTLRLKQHVSQH